MQFKVEWVEDTGKYKKATLKNEETGADYNVSVWPTLYGGKENSVYMEVKPGNSVKGIIKESPDGKYKNFQAELERPNFLKNKPSIAQAQEKKAEYIKEAQERRDNSIAYFNSVNSAIALLAIVKPEEGIDKDFITHWRDWFLQEWDRFNQEPNY